MLSVASKGVLFSCSRRRDITKRLRGSLDKYPDFSCSIFTQRLSDVAQLFSETLNFSCCCLGTMKHFLSCNDNVKWWTKQSTKFWTFIPVQRDPVCCWRTFAPLAANAEQTTMCNEESKNEGSWSQGACRQPHFCTWPNLFKTESCSFAYLWTQVWIWGLVYSKS